MNPYLLPHGNVRVLQVIAPGPVGGAESAVLGLSRGLVEAGAQVVIAALADGGSGPFVDRARAAGLSVVVVDSPGRNYLRDWYSLRHVIREHRIDVVHTHGYRADMMGLLAADSERVPSLATAHGFTFGSRKNRLNQWLAVRALRRHDAVIAVSDPLSATLRSLGIPAGRVVPIRNDWQPPPGPLSSRTEARARLQLPDDAPVLGWVGRLSHEKGADIAIAAMTFLSHAECHLAFVGEGRERTALESQVAAAGLGKRVHFLGMVPDAAAVLRAFDALLLSSRTEGTPMVLLEAIHARVPIIASAVGGVPDLLPAGTGLLVPPEDPVALAGAMAAVLADPSTAHARASAAVASLAARSSPAEWVSRHLAVYQRLLAQDAL
jgi:glycosyltransferase involved in cell wall biosynthesis